MVNDNELKAHRWTTMGLVLGGVILMMSMMHCDLRTQDKLIECEQRLDTCGRLCK